VFPTIMLPAEWPKRVPLGGQEKTATVDVFER
jgi:hypothetical protein